MLGHLVWSLNSLFLLLNMVELQNGLYQYSSDSDAKAAYSLQESQQAKHQETHKFDQFNLDLKEFGALKGVEEQNPSEKKHGHLIEERCEVV